MVYAIDFSNTNVNPVARITNLGTLINTAISLIMFGAGLVFLFMLISGAFMYLTSGDSAEQVKKAQSTFITAIIGLIIVVSSFLVVKILGYIFHIENILPI